MRVLNYNWHTPYNYYLAKAFPEIEWTVCAWFEPCRPLISNMRLVPEYDGSEYDVFTFSDENFDFKSVKAKRYIYVRHCGSGWDDTPLQSKYDHLLRNVNSFVVVSEHKRTHIHQQHHPKVVVIPQGIETQAFVPSSFQRNLIGSAHNHVMIAPCITGLLNNLVARIPDFKMIGFCDIPIPFCKNYPSRDYTEFITHFQSLSVFVHIVVGYAFGFTPLEAMACGLPVITGKNLDIPQWCRSSPGFFEASENGNVSWQWIADKAIELRSKPKLARDLGMANRAHVLKHATLNHFRENWSRVLNTRG